MEVASGDHCGSPDLPGYDSDDDPEDVSVDGPVIPPSHLVNERAVWLEQQHSGQVICTPSSRKLLSDMLDEVYTQLQPKLGDWDARHAVIQFITKFVNHKIPGSNFSAFGSFVMDLFTSSSDLDLSLNLADGKRDRSRNDKVHFLRKVAKALYGLQNGRQSVRGIETVYRAAVPVVKFIDCKTGIECDISVENNDGVLKSRVLGMVSTIDSRFRQLCYLVKAWAKKHNVNSSKNGTLNSLSICLLVAFHLQTCSPPILPPFSVFMEGLCFPAIERCLETVASRVWECKDRGFGKDNTESVPDLFGSFFLKLIAVESLWGQGLCSSTFEGKWISKIWPKNHIGCISVEDFADRTQNVARSVSRKEFDLIYQVLQSTVSNLKDPVFDVPEAKDLKSYLFGSIKQRHRGYDYLDTTALNMGYWQGMNGWPPSSDRSTPPNGRGHEQSANRINLANGKGHDSRTEKSLYTNAARSHDFYTPNLNHSQDGQGPGYRTGYVPRKAGLPNKIVKVDPALAMDGNGIQTQHMYSRRNVHSRVPHPSIGSRPSSVNAIKQAGLLPRPAYNEFVPPYQDFSFRNEDLRTKPPEPDTSCRANGYIYRDEDFPTMDGDRVEAFTDSVSYRGVAHSQMDLRGSRSHHSGTAILPATPQNQRVRQYRRGPRGRIPHPPGQGGHVQHDNPHGYQVHIGGNVHWQAQLPSSVEPTNF